jgi:hypothetical protein
MQWRATATRCDRGSGSSFRRPCSPKS